MRPFALAIGALCFATSIPLDAQERGIMGFTRENAERVRAAERIMASVPDSATMRGYHYALTRKPHHAGTEENYQLALYIRDKWEEFGFETEMVKYDILIPWPEELRLRLVHPEEIELAVTEPRICPGVPP